MAHQPVAAVMVSLLAWQLSKAATLASTAYARTARAPVAQNLSQRAGKVSGWGLETFVSVMAHHSFGREARRPIPIGTPPYPFMPSPTLGIAKCPAGGGQIAKRW
jgi:hypothetical protein